jgi:isoleucyl-tRNA synthetase
VQNLRKEKNLEVSDRITLSLWGSERLKAAWEAFTGYVAAETLAVQVLWEKTDAMTEIEAGEETWFAALQKA